MKDDLISRQAAIDAICNACGKIDCDKMDKCEKLQLPPANCSEFPNNSDTISRQAAIEALKGLPTWWADEGGYYGGAQPPMAALLDPEDAVSAIENLLSVQPQPEEDCATCKHGYFGDRQCDNCRVRYPSHYEREEEHHGSY